MELTNDQLGYIKSLGVLKTPIENIPLLLEKEFEEGQMLIKQLKDPKSREYMIYHSGLEKGNIAVKSALYEKAKKGDVFAVIELNKIQDKEGESEEIKRIYK